MDTMHLLAGETVPVTPPAPPVGVDEEARSPGGGNDSEPGEARHSDDEH